MRTGQIELWLHSIPDMTPREILAEYLEVVEGCCWCMSRNDR